jgi:hypothetical protein
VIISDPLSPLFPREHGHEIDYKRQRTLCIFNRIDGVNGDLSSAALKLLWLRIKNNFPILPNKLLCRCHRIRCTSRLATHHLQLHTISYRLKNILDQSDRKKSIDPATLFNHLSFFWSSASTRPPSYPSSFMTTTEKITSPPTDQVTPLSPLLSHSPSEEISRIILGWK